MADRHTRLIRTSEAERQIRRHLIITTMERLKNITEFVVVSNLENRALNAGIGKAQNWWRNRHQPDHQEPVPDAARPAVAIASAPPLEQSGQFYLTVLRAQDLAESRLSMVGVSPKERPYVVLEFNQQRFQTLEADPSSTHRNPQWTRDNGPFLFKIFDAESDRLTIWIQQTDPLRVLKGNDAKVLGAGEINLRQLRDQEQIWLPLRKEGKPAGQVLIQVRFSSHEKPSASYNKVL